MIILDGKKLNEQIASELSTEIQGFSDSDRPAPKLVILQIGDNPSSNVYIGRKIKFAEQIGAQAEVIKFLTAATTKEISEKIAELNSDESVHGIIMQLPIPDHIDFAKVINAIVPEKDVDGLCAENIYKLARNDSTGMVPATARGIATLLKENSIEIAGKNVVVIGRSLLVGKTTAMHLMNHDATVTICHTKTKDLVEKIKSAEIVIVAAGLPDLVKEEMLRADQIVVDVGISVKGDGKISGDVSVSDDFELRAISRVPGGVGPMTVASLFQNLLKAYKKL